MKINADQIYASVEADQAFAEWYVTEFMPIHVTDMDAAVSDPGKREMTIQGRRYAESFGINDVPSQYHFITLMWKVGPNFFTFSPFDFILGTAGSSGPKKIEECYAVNADIAADAIVGADDRYWYPDMIESAEVVQ